MTYLVVVNELSLFRLAWFALWRRRAVALTVDPLFPFLRTVLQRIADVLSRRLTGSDEFSDLVEDYETLSRSYLLTDVFPRCEPWIEKYFGFEEMDREGFEYAFPFRKVTVNRVQWHFGLFWIVDEIRRRLPDGAFTVIGIDSETVDFYQAFHGTPDGFRFAPNRSPRVTVNAILSLVTMGLALVRIGRWFTLRPAPPQPILLGVDAIASGRHYRMLKEVVDTESQVLAVFRNRSDYRENREWFAPFPTCPPFSGILDPAQALDSVCFVLARGLALWRRFSGLSPAHFFAVAKFPLIQLNNRALMEKYQFANFFGRDDYNVEHVFRAWELRRRGGVSLGINHGTPYSSTVVPMYRYNDFDIYYVYGEDIYRKNYLDKWSDSVRIKSVGAFGLTREQLQRTGLPRPPDIAFFVKPQFDGPEIVDALFEVARAFPDRTTYLKLKNNNVDSFSPEQKARFFADKPDNLILTENSADALYLEVRYAISTPSTVVFEAIQFNLVSFCYDTYPEDTPLQFREYPHLCYKTVGGIIKQIRDIEAGTWAYPRQSYGGLVDLSGQNVFDTIRADLGLPPKQPVPLEENIGQ